MIRELARKASALAGLTLDIARILFFRDWGEDEPKSEPSRVQGSAPVVRVTPEAQEMIARASPRASSPSAELLDGSVEARRAHEQSG